MIHLIKSIIAVEPFKLTLKFNSGETREIDLEQKLNEWSKSPDSKFRQLLDPYYFSNVKLDKELETICWENGIDLCPDVLYSLSEQTVEVK